jgi:hypothetical protein
VGETNTAEFMRVPERRRREVRGAK